MKINALKVYKNTIIKQPNIKYIVKNNFKTKKC